MPGGGVACAVRVTFAMTTGLTVVDNADAVLIAMLKFLCGKKSISSLVLTGTPVPLVTKTFQFRMQGCCLGGLPQFFSKRSIGATAQDPLALVEPFTPRTSFEFSMLHEMN